MIHRLLPLRSAPLIARKMLLPRQGRHAEAGRACSQRCDLWRIFHPAGELSIPIQSILGITMDCHEALLLPEIVRIILTELAVLHSQEGLGPSVLTRYNTMNKLFAEETANITWSDLRSLEPLEALLPERRQYYAGKVSLSCFRWTDACFFFHTHPFSVYGRPCKTLSRDMSLLRHASKRQMLISSIDSPFDGELDVFIRALDQEIPRSYIQWSRVPGYLSGGCRHAWRFATIPVEPTQELADHRAHQIYSRRIGCPLPCIEGNVKDLRPLWSPK